MPTYPAPNPATVVLDLPNCTVHVVAAERDDVVVTVLPADPTKPRDVRAADGVRVDVDSASLSITGPTWKQFVPFNVGMPVVTVELPAGANLSGKAGSVYTEGPLGTVGLKVNAGDARVEQAERLDITASAGAIVVGRSGSSTRVKAGSGAVRITELVGDATIQSSTGAITIGSAHGSVQVTGTHGDIVVGRIRGTLTARTAAASIRVDCVDAGTVTLTTSYGAIEVGVPEGTAAWLDVDSRQGSVRNLLTPTESPLGDESTAEIHARTGFGDIIVGRP